MWRNEHNDLENFNNYGRLVWNENIVGKLLVLPLPNKRFIFKPQSFPSFQSDDMRIVTCVATKLTRGPW